MAGTTTLTITTANLIRTGTRMADSAALLRLMSWLSPVFPTGSFAYSGGLERAVADGLVSDAETLREWTSSALKHGSQWNDAILLAVAWRAAGDPEAHEELCELAEALCGSQTRLRETVSQGEAFLGAATAWLPAHVAALPPKPVLPVAVGAIAAITGTPLDLTLNAYLHAFANAQLQAAIRLSVTGQKGTAALLAYLEPLILETAELAQRSSIDDLGGCAITAEIAAMNHSQLQPKLFLS